MNGPMVLLFVLAIVLLLVFAYLVGSIELESTLARWEEDRRIRADVEAERKRLAALRGPRVMRP